MPSLLRNTLTYVWLALVAATLLSWWAATSNGTGSASHISVSVTAGVLVMSFIKVRLVIMHFMEVRFAPLWLRLNCDAWLIVVLGMVFGFYWTGL